jgi:hypothetical protein
MKTNLEKLAPELLESLVDLLSLTSVYDVGQNSAIVDRARKLVEKLAVEGTI